MPLRDPKNQKKLEGFLIEHAPLINLELKKLVNAGKVHQDIDHSDLHTAGFHGLMDALHKYDPNMGAKFSTYAVHRIRGKMLDHLVSSGDVPKTAMTQAKNLRTLEGAKPTIDTTPAITIKPQGEE
jgi:RNA polymerase sigma factor for flagellar operon FliA